MQSNRTRRVHNAKKDGWGVGLHYYDMASRTEQYSVQVNRVDGLIG
jgi:hypothetical protein